MSRRASIEDRIRLELEADEALEERGYRASQPRRWDGQWVRVGSGKVARASTPMPGQTFIELGAERKGETDEAFHITIEDKEHSGRSAMEILQDAMDFLKAHPEPQGEERSLMSIKGYDVNDPAYRGMLYSRMDTGFGGDVVSSPNAIDYANAGELIPAKELFAHQRHKRPRYA